MCCLVLCVLLCYVNEEEADEEKEEGGRTGGVAAPKRKQEPHQDVGKKKWLDRRGSVDAFLCTVNEETWGAPSRPLGCLAQPGMNGLGPEDAGP